MDTGMGSTANFWSEFGNGYGFSGPVAEFEQLITINLNDKWMQTPCGFWKSLSTFVCSCPVIYLFEEEGLYFCSIYKFLKLFGFQM